MGNPLWAPWRMDYVLSKETPSGCVFCGIDEASDEERASRLVVVSGARAYVMLNRFPFTAGHLLVVPHDHVAAMEDLASADYIELFQLVREAARRLRAAVKADGLNVGVNLGAAAGAGIAAHLHVHIVPRWSGDTNFMPVLADTRVVPQALEKTREFLAPAFADLAAPRAPGGG